MTAMRLVVFDVDGTLVDSSAAFREALDRALAAEGRSLPEGTDPCSGVGLSPVQMFVHLLPGISDESAQRLASAYKAAYLYLRAEGRAEQAATLFPGTRAMLDRLSRDRGVLLGLATGKARRGVDFFLAHHGLERRFVTIQTADRHPSKPGPSMLLDALAETGVDARDAVMVGDTTFDIEMAMNARITGIGVTWGHHAADALRRAGARQVIGSWDGIDAAIGLAMAGTA